MAEDDEGRGDEVRVSLTAGSRNWRPWQVGAAGALLAIGLAMYTIDHLDDLLFGRAIDFGYLPLGLVLVGLYVLFGLDVIRAFRGGK